MYIIYNISYIYIYYVLCKEGAPVQVGMAYVCSPSTEGDKVVRRIKLDSDILIIRSLCTLDKVPCLDRLRGILATAELATAIHVLDKNPHFVPPYFVRLIYRALGSCCGGDFRLPPIAGRQIGPLFICPCRTS